MTAGSPSSSISRSASSAPKRRNVTRSVCRYVSTAARMPEGAAREHPITARRDPGPDAPRSDPLGLLLADAVPLVEDRRAGRDQLRLVIAEVVPAEEQLQAVAGRQAGPDER